VLRNKGSTRSIDNVVSALKRACVLSKDNWLDKTDELKLKALIAQWKLEDVTPSRRKRALRMVELKRMMDQSDLTDLVQLLKITMLASGHDGLLRSSEVLSGIRVVQILWRVDKEGFRLELPRSKMNRSGDSEFISFHDYGECSGAHLMRRWFDQNHLWGRLDSMVFPAVTRSGRLNFGKSPSYSWWRKVIKVKCKEIGLDDKLYSGHSLRAGGATDLFVAKVPYYIIKKMGRWKSEAAMLYYRCEEDVETSVAAAFSSLFELYKQE